MQKIALALVQFATVVALGHSAACATAGTTTQARAASAEEATGAVPTFAQRIAELEAEGPLHFDTDTDNLDVDARRVLRDVAAQLFEHPEARLLVGGHADERGDTAYNLALGERRAQAAREYLTRLGIDPSRVQLTSFGEEHPAVAGHDDGAWATNRRDEFLFLVPDADGRASIVASLADEE
jgi:peptidoglycan-associated lipoprotein